MKPRPLSPRLRIALKLYADRRLTQAEAARMCGIGQSAFAMRLARARRQMGVAPRQPTPRIPIYPIALGDLSNV